MWHTTDRRAPAGVWIKSDADQWFRPNDSTVFTVDDGKLLTSYMGDPAGDYIVSNPTQLSRFAEWLVLTGMSQAEAEHAVGLSAASLAEVERLQMPTDEEISAELEPPADYDEQVARKLKADDEAHKARVEVAGEECDRCGFVTPSDHDGNCARCGDGRTDR